MPSPQTGTPTPPPGQDGPSPVPGNAPTVQVPVGGDVGAAPFKQPLVTSADFLAYVQAILNGAPSFAPSNVPGFTAVTQVGGGAGSITGLTVGTGGIVAQPVNGAVALTFKVTVSGAAAGAAKMQVSQDGGKTYAAEVAIPSGVYTDPVSGISVNCSGVFVAGDLYAIRPTCHPQVKLVDSLGNVRHLFDHNGYPLGRRVEFREDWPFSNSVAMGGSPPYSFAMAAGAPPTLVLAANGGRWQLSGDASFGTLAFVSDAVLGCNALKLSTGTSNTKSIALATMFSAFKKTAFTVLVAEWEAMLSAVGATNVTFVMGISDALSVLSGATNRMQYRKTAGSNNWFVASNGAPVDTSRPPTAATWQRFKMELHGAGTPLGVALGAVPVMLFFVDDLLVNVITAGVMADGATPMYLGFGMETTAGLGGAVDMYISPVLCTYARCFPDRASMPPL